MSAFLLLEVVAALDDLENEYVSSDANSRGLAMYLYGRSFAVAPDVMNAPVNSLCIKRCPFACGALVFVLRKDKEKPKCVAGI